MADQESGQRSPQCLKLEHFAGTRDRAPLTLLLGCGLRRAELLRLNVEDLEQRASRWVIRDLVDKANRLRLIIVPAGVKAWMDAWAKAACITEGSVVPSNHQSRKA